MTPASRPQSLRRRATAASRPPADPSAGSSTDLVSVIRAEIDGSPDRRITFARYMELALYAPDLGYYRVTTDRPTRVGDFLTAPETHAIFGWTVARRIESIWAEVGRPRPFHLIEYGAGSGTLALAVLEGFGRHGSTELLQAITYEPVESNPNRLGDLRLRFEKAGLTELLAKPGSPGTEPVPVDAVILANEFLDALPVHRVVVLGGELRELFVTWLEHGDVTGSGAGDSAAGGGRFAELAAEPSTPELAARLEADAVELAERQVAEIALGLDPWLQEVDARLRRGRVLVIDYGFDAAELYGPRRLAGTLLGYRGHRVEQDPFASPGRVDLTAHVDFTALRKLAERRGFRTVSETTQSDFLEEELLALQASPDLTLAAYAQARSGIVRMLDPRHMGRFRVLVLARG